MIGRGSAVPLHKTMYKKIIIFPLLTVLLSSCISISVDSSSLTSRPNFVTATLMPTRAGFVPATPTLKPEATLAPTLAITAAANCTDTAVLLRDVTIQDDTQLKPGEKFTKTWEFKNNGTCPWIDYKLTFNAGDQMNAPLSAPIPDTAPKDTVQASVELTAPSSNGTYTGYFTLNDANGRDIPIGIEKNFWVRIVVGSGSAAAVNPVAAVTNTLFVPAGGNNNCAYSANGGLAREVIALINQARAAAQLPALTVNSQLMSAAQTHSADMACNNFLDHTGSDGSWIGDRLRAAGYNSFGYSEIIAIGPPQNAINQWAADPPHWEIVLSPTMTEIGAGYAYYANSDFGAYITVDMAGP
jgi:uncharacterized protein YkwD